MKILVSTTFLHNPGDEILLEGVKRLLYAKYGSDLEFLYYNRNPDLQEGPEREARKGLVGNYMSSASLLRHVDLVVCAASPEWNRGPLKALYQGILDVAPKTPLLAVGVGLGTQWGSLDELDIKVLSRPETTITTRSHETTEMLASYGKGIKSTALVCPALFSFENKADPSSLRSDGPARTLLILQAPGHGWHEVPERILPIGDDAGQRIMSEHDILTIHVKEFEYYSEMFEFEKNYHSRVRYAGSVDEFKRIVSQYDRVISTRLHGAIGALSLGIPATIVSDGDFRIETCAAMFGEGILPVRKTVREALYTEGKLLPAFQGYKQRLFDQHLKALA